VRLFSATTQQAKKQAQEERAQTPTLGTKKKSSQNRSS